MSRFKSLCGCSAFLAVVLTLRMAWFRRQPGRQARLIFYRDRGNQCASRVFKELLNEYDITASMSRRGN